MSMSVINIMYGYGRLARRIAFCSRAARVLTLEHRAVLEGQKGTRLIASGWLTGLEGKLITITTGTVRRVAMGATGIAHMNVYTARLPRHRPQPGTTT